MSQPRLLILTLICVVGFALVMLLSVTTSLNLPSSS